MAKILLLLSMPEAFEEKFVNFVHNINAINSDKSLPVVIEGRKIMEESDIAAIPKRSKDDN